jgi:hypothetical protein
MSCTCAVYTPQAGQVDHPFSRFKVHFYPHQRDTTPMFLPLHGWLYLVPLLRKGGTSTTTSQTQSTSTTQPDTRYNLTDPQPFPWSVSSMGTCCVWKFKKGLPGAAHTARQTKVQIFLGLSLPKNMFTLPVWIEQSTAYCTGGWGSSASRAGRIWQRGLTSRLSAEAWAVHSTVQRPAQRVLR